MAGELAAQDADRYTERTVIDPSAMEQEAATTRQRGYAIDEGEYRRGVHALAAAVHDRAGEAIAAIGVSSAGRLNVETVSDDVVAVAARLTEALTHGDAESAR